MSAGHLLDSEHPCSLTYTNQKAIDSKQITVLVFLLGLIFAMLIMVIVHCRSQRVDKKIYIEIFNALAKSIFLLFSEPFHS